MVHTACWTLRRFSSRPASLPACLFRREAATSQLSQHISTSLTPPPRSLVAEAAAKSHPSYATAAKASATHRKLGKNQHSKDRMFITATEHAGLYGGYKKKKTIGLTGALPFDCCALSLLPFRFTSMRERWDFI